MTTPQNVSSRYVRNLIVAGRNSNFEIDAIRQMIAKSPSGLPCGVYYLAIVKRTITFESDSQEGATPEAAVAACLRHFGVTFA